ncbi:MAG: hypothetical protein AMJ58_02795 [Gammaproteobacteria bacterium SG8_30]|jgi:hypothetical protein|nr:MAG: hypothetical protein AMJ58_02795 [Gammaproteobacteria bacterium SG8_30]
MTPADERITALLSKWAKSLDLHSRYTELTDDQYWLVQPWPEHQRPNRWIVDLAGQRLSELLRIFQSRVAAGDQSLAEALELMLFLTNLVGSQHVQRFIPMAEPEQERPIQSLTVRSAHAAVPPAGPASRPPTDASPGIQRPDSAPPAARPKQPTPAPAPRAAPRVEDPLAPPSPRAGAQSISREATPPTPAAPGVDAGSKPSPWPRSREDDVLRDAVRLLSWGREWHELPQAIARMSGRPDGATVREILKVHRAAIEQRVAEGAAST